MKKLIIFSSILLFISSVSTYAQYYKSTNYKIEDGLPTFFLKDVEQDSLGYLWIASDDGLVRFDGEEFITFQEPFEVDFIKHIYPFNNRLFVVSDLGCYEIHPDHFNPTISLVVKGGYTEHPDKLLYPKSVFHHAPTEKLWFVEEKSVASYDLTTNKLQRYSIDDPYVTQSYTHPYFLLNWPDSSLKIINQRGQVLELEESTSSTKLFYESRELLHTTINSIIPINETHSVFGVGTEDGIYTMRFSSGNPSIRKHHTLSQINAMHQLSSSTVVVGTKSDAIYYWNIEEDDLYPENSSYIKEVTSIFKDDMGNIWVTSDFGLVLMENNFFNYLELPSISQNVVFVHSFPSYGTVVSTLTDIILVSKHTSNYTYTINKLHSFDRGIYALSITKHDNKLIAGLIDGSLWIYDIDTQEYTIEYPHEYLTEIDSNGSIFGVLSDSQGNLWMLKNRFNGVLKKGKNGKYEAYIDPNYPNTERLDLAESKTGDIYVTGNHPEAYLFHYDASKNTFINKSVSLPITLEPSLQFHAHDITITPSNELWIASNYGVLRGMSPEELEVFTIEDYIRPDFIRSIDVENNGIVWIGSENGVYVYSNQSWLEFTMDDGLPGVTVNFRSIDHDRHGTAWIGTNQGLGYSTAQSKIIEQTKDPIISYFSSQSNEDTFSSTFLEDEYITLQLRTLTFPSNKNNFYYRINQDKWQKSTTTSITLEQLPQGFYTFEVYAQKRGLSPSNSVVYSFKVSVPWYKTTIALLLYSILGIGFIFVVIGYRSNVKQRNIASQKLYDTELRLSIVLENAPILFFTTNLEGKITLYTGSESLHISQNPDYYLNRPYQELFPSEPALNAFHTALKGNRGLFKISINNRVYETRLTPVLDNEGHVLELNGVSFDVTERDQYQQELIEEKNIAEKANNAKSIFLANMTHELRTPLNAILGFSQLLLKLEALPQVAHKYISTIFKSGQHLLLMINEILDVSKIESGNIELHPHEINLKELITDLNRMFQIQATHKNLTFKTILFDPYPSHIIVDEKKLKQVLINIIGNAIKFTETGKVSVLVQCETVHQNQSKLSFRIEDTGKGIEEEMMDEIFKPFKQGFYNHDEGTGLGLSIAKGIIEKMEGSISVTSTVGKGSTFVVSLQVPIVESDLLPLGNEDSKVGAQTFTLKHSPNVLVVDDVEENRSLLSSFLASYNCSVEQCENGFQAEEKVKRNSYDLIFLDIFMPQRDGKETFKLIKNIPEYKDVPIIAITAGGNEVLKKELLSLGFDDFIHKPFLESDLFKVIVEQLHDYIDSEEMNTERLLSEEEETIVDIDTLISDLRSSNIEDLSELFDALEMNDMESIYDFIQNHEVPHKSLLIEKLEAKEFQFFINLSDKL